MFKSKICGIILAGGESKRAHQNKMLLKFDNKPLILHTIDSIKPFVDKIVVVTGRYHDELAPMLDGVEVIYNKDYEKGMFSSVKAGVNAIEGNFFIIPGDCPFVSKPTFKSLLKEGDFSIRVPAYLSVTGHPIYFSSKMKDVILNRNLDSNLREIRDEIGYETVEVNDANILNDIDTLNDYTKMLNALERN